MKKVMSSKAVSIILMFVMAITLGGLGTAALSDHFYWVAFILNLAIYVFLIWGVWTGKLMLKDEVKVEDKKVKREIPRDPKTGRFIKVTK